MMLFIIVLLGITLMAVAQHWSVVMKRDREAELAFRGNRIKEAIERYVADYEVQKATRANRYPLKLEDLTKRPKRYLQAVYKDPITGEDFALIKVGKDIRGVRSPSMDAPMDLVTTGHHANGSRSTLVSGHETRPGGRIGFSTRLAKRRAVSGSCARFAPRANTRASSSK